MSTSWSTWLLIKRNKDIDDTQMHLLKQAKILRILIVSIVFYILGCFSTRPIHNNNNPLVLISTALGDITIEIYSDKAPITAANFLRYVDENRYKDAAFYRVVRMDNQPDNDIKIEVIQGGIGFVESELRLPPITHETTNETGINHTDGVISMARLGPGSADSEFFICIGDQPELDFGGKRNSDGQGFAAFGKVIKGMDVVRKIQQLPADGQMLVSPVKINKITKLR